METPFLSLWCADHVLAEAKIMAPSFSTNGTTPKMLPPLQLRAQKLHAVLVKIVQHCNDKVMAELQAEITAFQGTDKFPLFYFGESIIYKIPRFQEKNQACTCVSHNNNWRETI